MHIEDLVIIDTPLEWLREVWQELLNIPLIENQDDFFELGADSLTLIKLLSRIQNKFGVNAIALDLLFEKSHLDEMASLLHSTSL